MFCRLVPARRNARVSSVSIMQVSMQPPVGRSWRVDSDHSDLALHFALWVRDASGLVVDQPTDSVPPPLLTPPDRIKATVTTDDWLAWWDELLRWRFEPPEGEPQFADLQERAWGWLTLCPSPLAQAVEPFHDQGLAWVRDKVKAANRHRGPDLLLLDGVQSAVQRLQRELGSRLDSLDVSIRGLAVEGEWQHVGPVGSAVLVSWALLDRPESWIVDALRPAALAAAQGD